MKGNFSGSDKSGSVLNTEGTVFQKEEEKKLRLPGLEEMEDKGAWCSGL